VDFSPILNAFNIFWSEEIILVFWLFYPTLLAVSFTCLAAFRLATEMLTITIARIWPE
jgi:hypothetical protein